MKRIDPDSKRVSVGLDFTFNALRNVHRVGWKQDVPWYREITDGMSWFAYFKNHSCQAYKQMFIISKGYGIFKMSKDIPDI